MLQREHFAILLTCIKLPFVIKIFVLSIFEWFYCILKKCAYSMSCLVLLYFNLSLQCTGSKTPKNLMLMMTTGAADDDDGHLQHSASCEAQIRDLPISS